MSPRVLSSIAAALCLAGCASQSLAAPCAPKSPENIGARPRPTQPLRIAAAGGPVTLQVELADDDAERSQGLMCRRTMGPNHGMLFDFKSSRPVYFWMRNTLISLDMIFIGADGRIVAIAPQTVPLSEAPVGPGVPVLAVLELAAGRAAALGVRPGDRVSHPIFSRR